MLGKADEDPEGRFKIEDVNVKRCVGIFTENELIFGKSGLELGAILVRDNLLFFGALMIGVLDSHVHFG